MPCFVGITALNELLHQTGKTVPQCENGGKPDKKKYEVSKKNCRPYHHLFCDSYIITSVYQKGEKHTIGETLIWDIKTDTMHATIPKTYFKSSNQGAVFGDQSDHPNLILLVNKNKKHLIVHNTETKEHILIEGAPGDKPIASPFCEHGNRFYSYDSESPDKVKIWNSFPPYCIAELGAPNIRDNAENRVQLNPDGTEVLIKSSGKSCILFEFFDVDSQKKTDEYSTEEQSIVHQCMWDPQRKTLYTLQDTPTNDSIITVYSHADHDTPPGTFTLQTRQQKIAELEAQEAGGRKDRWNSNAAIIQLNGGAQVLAVDSKKCAHLLSVLIGQHSSFIHDKTISISYKYPDTLPTTLKSLTQLVIDDRRRFIVTNSTSHYNQQGDTVEIGLFDAFKKESRSVTVPGILCYKSTPIMFVPHTPLLCVRTYPSPQANNDEPQSIFFNAMTGIQIRPANVPFACPPNPKPIGPLKGRGNSYSHWIYPHINERHLTMEQFKMLRLAHEHYEQYKEPLNVAVNCSLARAYATLPVYIRQAENIICNTQKK